MSSRFARPTHATLARYRTERDRHLADARANYDRHGDARRTLALLTEAWERQRKVMWARKALGLSATTPTTGLGTPGGRP